MQNIFKLLSETSYPGRGILLGKSKDGHGIIAYFIMGRSENSRNRIFEYTSDGIRTAPHDPAKVKDPSLIIYRPLRCCEDGRIIVTNGDQTDTLYDAFQNGEDWQTALRTRTFEPDPPNWTPRISGVLLPNGSYMLSILKSAHGNAKSCARYFFEYEDPEPGTGHFISTYKEDGNPLPSFEGEPVWTDIPQTNSSELADALWNVLNPANRVSLYTAFVNNAEADDIHIEQNVINAYR